jgi:pimeloyl-ACP methyl ester carboxylesterase
VNTARSRDGTTIAFDRIGAGPAVVTVGGAFSYRSWKGFERLADVLADRFSVVTYDRRGRGDSGNTQPYAVEREIEDLDAVIEAVGEPALVWGISSGGVLALRAAASGVPISRLVVYQPPFSVDDHGHLPPPDFGARLDELVAANRRGDAVAYFMTKGMGVPTVFVRLLPVVRPIWRRLAAVAHTLPYDYAVMGDTVSGKPLDASPWTSIDTPTLVLAGGKSPASLHGAADALAALLPNAERRTLDGQSHNVSMNVLGPVLAEFLTRDENGRAQPASVAVAR